jgi:hypothetical protein
MGQGVTAKPKADSLCAGFPEMAGRFLPHALG